MTGTASAKKLWRCGPWLVILVAAVAYYHRFVKAPVGMEMYPKAAYCLLHGAMLQTCDIGFTYPPIFAFLMLPFEPLPLWLRDLVWYVVTVGASIGSFKLAETLAAEALDRPLSDVQWRWVRFFGLLFSAKLILAVFENQAYDALVLLVLLLGLTALVRGHELGAGCGLAVAAALKATPLIFLPYLLWRRQFAAAAAFVVVFVAVSLLPDLFFAPASGQGYFLTWLRQVAGAPFGLDPGAVKNAFWAGANIMNHSLHGAVSLNIDERTQHALNSAVLYAVDAVFIIVVGTMIAIVPNRRAFIAIDASLLLISMLMLSPMTSRSHYVAMILPYLTLLAMNFRDRRTQWLGRAVLAASFALMTLTGNDVVGQSVTVWAYRHSSMVAGTLLLLIYFAPLVLECRRRESLAAAAPHDIAGLEAGVMNPAE